jgi:hypothetical protein
MTTPTMATMSIVTTPSFIIIISEVAAEDYDIVMGIEHHYNEASVLNVY